MGENGLCYVHTRSGNFSEWAEQPTHDECHNGNLFQTETQTPGLPNAQWTLKGRTEGVHPWYKYAYGMFLLPNYQRFLPSLNHDRVRTISTAARPTISAPQHTVRQSPL